MYVYVLYVCDVIHTDTSNTALTFVGGSNSYSTVWFDRGASTGIITISGSNIFNTFKDTGTKAHTIRFTDNTNNSFYNWIASGTSGEPITISKTSTGTNPTLTSLGDDFIVSDYLILNNLIGYPENIWYMGANSTDPSSSCTNMYLSAPPAVLPARLNIGDKWKYTLSMYINIGDVWKSINNLKVNISDTWKNEA